MGSVANVYSRQMRFVHAGDIEHGHVHQYDHLTLLAAGGLLVRAKGRETAYSAPCMIWINKDIEHELVATVDETVAYCIHAHRDLEGDIISPEMVPAGAQR